MAGACVDAQCAFNEARGARGEIDGEKQASPRQLRAAGPRGSRDPQAEELQPYVNVWTVSVLPIKGRPTSLVCHPCDVFIQRT